MAYLSALNAEELGELILDLEEAWGVELFSARPPDHSTMGYPIMGMPHNWDVIVVGCDKRIPLIKALRIETGLSLKECRDMVDRIPFAAGEDMYKEEAHELRDTLVAAGAKVELR